MICKLLISDLVEGQQYSFKKIFTRDIIETFSALTGDYHPLHTDQHYANLHEFDNIIIQGFLLTSLMSYVVGMELPGENALILSQESKFIRPVYIDEEVTYICEITKIDLRFSTFILLYTIFNKSGLKAVSGSVTVKVRKPKG
jgi:3-hydroxybutyryl-CoA dehydratase